MALPSLSYCLRGAPSPKAIWGYLMLRPGDNLSVAAAAADALGIGAITTNEARVG